MNGATATIVDDICYTMSMSGKVNVVIVHKHKICVKYNKMRRKI